MSMALYIDRDNTKQQMFNAPSTSNAHMVQTMNLLGYETDENVIGHIEANDIKNAIFVAKMDKTDAMMEGRASDMFIDEVIAQLEEAQRLGCGVYWV